MEWAKLKNIIILILLALNLCLLILVVYREEKTALFAQDVLEDAITVLSNNGITVDTSLPRDSDALSLCSATRNSNMESAFATAFLGNVTSVEELAGGFYQYSGPNGTLKISSGGEFTCSFTSTLSTDADLISDLCQYYSGLGFQAEQSSEEPVNHLISISLLWQDTPLLLDAIELNYSDQALTSISGFVLTSPPVESPSDDAPLSTATLLMQFLIGITDSGDVCSTITDITPAYLVVHSALTDIITLTPIWIVTTDTGCYYLDTITGEFSRQ